MRKLMSKKGFTLVELMIVVVILGILVAIAVPIFGAVTKNAKKKSCLSNMRVIKGNMETYAMTGSSDGAGDQVSFAVGTTNLGSGDSNFVKLFDGGIPVCPDAKDDNAQYTIYVTATAEGVQSFTVVCPKTHGTLGD